jgi:hypothetical protein
MNHASQWRIEFAREIAGWYAGQAQVRMIALGGSAARGLADAYSDMDMAVYWQDLDRAWLDQPPLEPAGGQRFTYRLLFDERVAVEQYQIGEAKLDVAHFSLAWLEQAVADVQERADMTPDYQEVLDGFLSAIPFYGEPLYQQWRTRIAAYPDELARRMIRQHLAFPPAWVLEQHGLARGDLLSFYAMVCEMVQNLLGVLAGLNRQYLSMEKPKRSADILRRMPIAPRDAAARVQAILTIDRRQAVAALAELIADVLDLVEQHMPEIDTARARMIQRMPARPCAEKPAFPQPTADDGR